MNTCYKVLHKKQSGTLVSVVYHGLPKAFVTIYYRSKETFPSVKGTPLLAFKTFGDAMEFWSGFPTADQRNLVIYECKYSEEFEFQPQFIFVPLEASSWEIERLWHEKTILDSKRMPVPSGTIFVKSLTLKEQLYRYPDSLL